MFCYLIITFLFKLLKILVSVSIMICFMRLSWICLVLMLEKCFVIFDLYHWSCIFVCFCEYLHRTKFYLEGGLYEHFVVVVVTWLIFKNSSLMYYILSTVFPSSPSPRFFLPPSFSPRSTLPQSSLREEKASQGHQQNAAEYPLRDQAHVIY